MPPPKRDLKRTVIIEAVAPTVDGGRYAVKREIGAVVEVSADIFKEAHDVLVAFLKYRRAGETAWRETPMRHVDNDRWAGRFTLDAVGRWVFTIEALPDPFQSWLADLGKRLDAGPGGARGPLRGGGPPGAAGRGRRDGARRTARLADAGHPRPHERHVERAGVRGGRRRRARALRGGGPEGSAL